MEIFDELGFLTRTLSCPQLENFWAMLLSMLQGHGGSVKAVAEWLEGWKDQSALNRFLSVSGWSTAAIVRLYHQWLCEKVAKYETVYFLLDDSKLQKSGNEYIRRR